MSEQKVTRLHPITLIINFVSQIKGFVIPAAVLLVSTFSSLTFDPNEKFFVKTLIYTGIMALLVILFAVFSWIKWRKFVYWFEDGELRIEYGLFVKKKRYIPFERIQTLNYKESIFHRIFKLVRVEIETAGDSSGSSEGELTAITREQAEQIEIEMNKAKNKVIHSDDEDSEEVTIEKVPAKKSIYKMTNKELILLASTSSSMGLLFASVFAIGSQFNDLIPYEQIYGEMQNIIKFGVVFIIVIVLLLILFAWIVAVALAYIVNYNFKIEELDDKIFISKGLLEKKSLTMPLYRIQGIRIVENPIRQIFGYCRVVVDSAGGTGDEKEDTVVLLPFIKKKEAVKILQTLFPQYIVEDKFVKVPRKSLFRYLMLPIYFLVIPIAAVSYFFYPYGLFSLIIVPIWMIMKFWQYKTAGFAMTDLQLTIVYRFISKSTVIISKNRIQAMTMKQSFFAERKDIATNKINIMSGMAGFTAKTKHFAKEDQEQMLEWYKPNA